MRPPQVVLAASTFVVIFAITGAAPALGAEPSAKPPAAAAKQAKEAAPKDKLVCTRREVAGSVIPKRVCETQKQVDAQRQAVDDLVSERREIGGTRTEALGLTPSR
jgi:hypothetical protein